MKVSVVVPVKNEENYIKEFLQSLARQTYPKSEFEVIFADGHSADNTATIIMEFAKTAEFSVKYLVNDKENAPSGVNLGIRNAEGEIIVRMDAHTKYVPSYIEKNVYYLKKGIADNVGCPINTIGVGKVGEAISYMLASKFGVGNSAFRISKEGAYVDTVPFGCFYKRLVEKIGFFDETMPRSEDNDFNYRIRQSGGKVYMFGDIESDYYSRTTIKSLLKMGYGNGKGIAQLLKKDRKAASVRHLIPFTFFVGNVVGIVCTLLGINIVKYPYVAALICYLVLDLLFSAKGIKELKISQVLLCVALYPMFHLSYGAGTFIGLLE